MINLKEEEMEIVKKILSTRFKDKEILIFGSRITDRVKPYSDLDLAIKSKEKLSLRDIDLTKEEFEESKLNFSVDLMDYDRIPENFKRIIDKKHEIINI